MPEYSVFAKPTGSGMIASAPTIEEALVKARDYAQLLLDNDIKREYCAIEVYDLCKTCDGVGKIRLKRRSIYGICKPCKVCEGEPVTVLHAESYLRA